MNATDAELTDPALLDEVDLARAAAQVEAADEEVGAHVGAHVEGETAVTHLFEAAKPGYRGWSWAVTVASAGPDTDVTISEVVLLPGPDALVAPDWVPWEHRVKAGDLGVGDLLPTADDDPRLVPAYVASDDPAIEEEAREAGLGRARVMARPARQEAAARWQHSEFGPRSDMARSAPAHCGTCGFYLPLAGSLRAAFGTCGNELSPADGHVVHAEYGCGAHSEAEVEQVSPVLVANLIYDDALLDVEPIAPAPEPEPAAVDEAAPAAEPEPPASEAAAPVEPVVTAETSLGAGAPSTLTPWIRPEGEAKRTELPDDTTDSLEPYQLISPEPTSLPAEPAVPAPVEVHATDPNQLEFPTDVAEPTPPELDSAPAASDSITTEPSAPPAGQAEPTTTEPAEQEPASSPEAASEAPDSAPELESDPAPESSTQTESGTQAEPDTQAEPESSTVTDPAPEPVSDPEPAAGPEPKSDGGRRSFGWPLWGGAGERPEGD